MADLPPWRSAPDLQALLACWRAAWAGHAVARVVVGDGWVRLTLVARDVPAAHLFLCARPGAVLLCDEAAPPDATLREALGPPVRSPLGARLTGATLRDARLHRADLAVALTFAPRRAEPPLRLVHQLFGSRGNVFLIEGDDRLAWSLHPGVPPALLLPPELEPEAAGDSAPAGDVARDVCRAAALDRLTAHLAGNLAAGCARAVRQAAAACDRLRDNLERDLAEAARGDELRRAAEALAVALREIPRGAARVELPDPAGGPPVTVALDPALSPVANMEEYFRRARKAQRGRARIAERLAETRQREAALLDARAQLTAIAAQPEGRLAACLAWRRAHAALLARASVATAGGARPAAPPARPFRRYLIEGRWEVWLGRDNAENDELTHSAAAPTDIWLHAQGVTGSHAVLRTGGRPEAVPPRVLEKAAALAALHSRARHSALVPVVHTLRKYVRKPRHSLPGTAACQREKTIFAAPGVAAGVEPA